MDPRLQKTLDAIDGAVAGMDEAALAATPRPGKWSAAQILEHLALSYILTSKGVERCLELGKPLATSASWGQRAGAFFVLTLGYLPRGRKSPQRVLPRGMAAGEVVGTIRRSLIAMDAALAQAEAKFGRRTKLADHPVLGAFTVDQWRRFHQVHGLHHVKQLQALKDQQRSAQQTDASAGRTA